MRLKSLLVGSLLVVWQLGCGGSPQKGPFQVRPPCPNPQANISILPTNAFSGSADLTLVINGSQTFSFAAGGPRYNKVLWSANGSETQLSATFVSSSQLTAIVPRTLLISPVQAKLRVEIWDHIEGSFIATRPPVPFSVATPPTSAPSITSI